MGAGEADTAEGYFAHFLRTLQTASGAMALFLLLVLVILLWVYPQIKWAVLSLLIYVSTLSFHDKPWFRTEVIAPLEVARLHSRNICMGLMLVLA